MAAMAASIRSRLHLAAGRVAEAVTEAEAGLANTQELEQELLVPLALSTLATVAIRRGDLATATEHVERGRTQLAGSSEATAVRITWLAGQLAEARGGPGWAVDLLADVYDSPPSRRQLLLEEPAAAAWLVRAALGSGDRGRAEGVVAGIEQLAADVPDCLKSLAAAAHARGLFDQVPRLLERAMTLYRDPWAQASAAEDLGRLLCARAARGDRKAAVSMLEEALDGYEETGAGRDVARVRGRLRRLGVRRRHWKRAVRPDSGWASLTDTERAVVDLVAAGLTNREVAARMFLSPHTIGYHLRHVFRKLEITSRVELALLTSARKQRLGS
jgi:DNA-binding CsgD family transcriptional regulator